MNQILKSMDVLDGQAQRLHFRQALVFRLVRHMFPEFPERRVHSLHSSSFARVAFGDQMGRLETVGNMLVCVSLAAMFG